jgi:acetyl/propionyl-CoA carboxylase alpha subunit
MVTGCETSFPQGIRFDNCLYRGLTVTPDFDPMVGKLISKGIIRSVAIRKMNAALDGLLIEGLKTNIPLHKVIMKNETFIKGTYSTSFITTEKPQDQVDTAMDFSSIYKKIAGIEARRMGL